MKHYSRFMSQLAQLTCVACLLFASCTTATIQKRDGTVVRGEIVSSSDENIDVRPSADPTAVPVTIPRRQIASIAHPGSTAGPASTVVAVLGLLTTTISAIVLGQSASNRDASKFFTGATGMVVGGTLLVPATVVAIWSFSAAARSRSAAAK